MFCSLPEYRRLGVASLQMDFGIEQADRDPLKCFVEASVMGRPLYEKYGFVGQEPFEIPSEGFTCTVYVRPIMK